MMSPNTEKRDSRSTAQLFSELSREVTDLVRHEVALAKTEIREKVSQAESGIVMAVAGGLLAYAGLLVLLVAAVAGLAEVVPLWLSALIIGGAVVIIGLGLLQKARSNLKPDHLALRHTSRAVRGDKDMIKEHFR